MTHDVKINDVIFDETENKRQIILTNTFRTESDFIKQLKYRYNGENKKIPHFFVNKKGDVTNLLNSNVISDFFAFNGFGEEIILISLENLGWVERVPTKDYYSNFLGYIKKTEIYKKKLEQRHILNPILPHLEGLMIYDDCIVEPGYSYNDEIDPNKRSKFYGYYTIQGKYRNLNEKGDLIFVGDKTIGHLLNKIYKALALDKNPSFEYIEHISNSKSLSHEHEGFDSIFEGSEMLSFVSNYLYQ